MNILQNKCIFFYIQEWSLEISFNYKICKNNCDVQTHSKVYVQGCFSHQHLYDRYIILSKKVLNVDRKLNHFWDIKIWYVGITDLLSLLLVAYDIKREKLR